MKKRARAGLWATCALLTLHPTAVRADESDVVLYASEAVNLRGHWSRTADATAAGGQMMSSGDAGWAATTAPVAAPLHSFEFTFDAAANTPYHVWVHARATGNSKFSDSFYVQFSDAVDPAGAPLYRTGSTAALLVNLATDASGKSLNGWGWYDGAYWLAQPRMVRFAAGGTHTIRIQTREDGVQIDQVVLSAATYLWAAPDAILPRPLPSPPVLMGPAAGAIDIDTNPRLTWDAAGATSYDLRMGASNPPAAAAAALPTGSFAPFGLAPATTYYWQVIARNSGGATSGPIWSFRTVAAPPNGLTPITPSTGAASVPLDIPLAWSASSAVSYDLKFGTSNPPPAVVQGLTSGWYAPAGLTNSTQYFWQVVARNAGGATPGPVWSFTTVAALPTPFGGTASALPGTIEAEHFDNGANGSAYYDASSGNTGSALRQSDVDLESSSENGFNVGWAYSGEWLHYSVNVHAAGVYVLDARVASAGVGGTFHVEFNGVDATGAIVIPDTGGWQKWTNVTRTVTLAAGHQAMRVVFDGSGQEAVGNLNWIRVSPAPPPAPSTPVLVAPVAGGTSVTTTAQLAWNAAGATSYDLLLGSSNPPAPAAGALTSTSFSPSVLSHATTYYWRVVARNAGGTTEGPVWSFTTVQAPPETPSAPVPATGSTPTSISSLFAWTASGATTYDVAFGTTSPPPQVATGLAAPTFAPSGMLVAGVTYYWQVVANNDGGSKSGPIWTFTISTPSPTASIVIYASDVPADALHGSWSVASDATSPNGIKLTTVDAGLATLNNPLASPADYVDVSFEATAGMTYRLWLRLKARNNSKYNDAVWVQLSNALVNGAVAYPINSTTGLLVNLATDGGAASLNGWGWQSGAYWLSQSAKVTFVASGPQTMRIQIREDGVELDQIVLSPVKYLDSAPGSVTSDATILPLVEPPPIVGPPPPPLPPPPPPPLPGPDPINRTWSVAAGGNLQTVINSAQAGDTILLEAGATFTGNFVLPVKSGSSYITIRSAAPDSALPGPTSRMTPSYAPLLPKLQSPNVEPALRTAAGAHHYRLQFLDFPPTRQGYYDIITLGDGSRNQYDLSQVPYELVIDRVYVHGDPVYGQKRGIALNSAATTITNSHISGMRAIGQDSQAIAGWNGPGPFTITNNYLEGAGENLIFGGSDPAIPGLVPSDIVIRGNHLFKPLWWRNEPQWTVKNLLELKSAQRVVIDGNILENNWLAGQSGYAVLFTPRNQDGGAPWTVVQHVEFTNNVVRNVASAINMLGRDYNYPSLETNHIAVRNNLFENISGSQFGGHGRLFVITEGGHDITFDHNTVLQDGWSVIYVSKAVRNFVFTNNIVPDYSWAIMGDGQSAGNATIAAYFPYSTIRGNVFAGSNASKYPAANHYPLSFATVGFVNYLPLSGGNYRLGLTSLFRNAGDDGKDVGVDFNALNAAAGTAY